MANEDYVRKGTSKLVSNGSGKDVTFTVEGLANSAGRVSTQIDWGAAPRPYLYHWSCTAQWQATPTQGALLELYIATAPDADSSQIDGDPGATDAALGDVDMRRNMRPIGAVVSENAAANEACVASGYFTCYERYMSIVAYNAGGSSIHATANNFKFNIVPVYRQGQ